MTENDKTETKKNPTIRVRTGVNSGGLRTNHGTRVRLGLTKIIPSGAVILTLGVAIAASLLSSPSATAAPNSVMADLKVVSIGTLTDGHWCPTDNGSSLTYRVVYENVRDDQAYNARVSFTTGSNQVVTGTYVGRSWSGDVEPTVVCNTWTAPNGYSKVAYCDIDSWNTMGGKLTFDFTVTTTADDLNVAAQVSSLISDADGQGASLMYNNYLEHAYDSDC